MRFLSLQLFFFNLAVCFFYHLAYSCLARQTQPHIITVLTPHINYNIAWAFSGSFTYIGLTLELRWMLFIWHWMLMSSGMDRQRWLSCFLVTNNFKYWAIAIPHICPINSFHLQGQDPYYRNFHASSFLLCTNHSPSATPGWCIGCRWLLMWTEWERGRKSLGSAGTSPAPGRTWMAKYQRWEKRCC